jgi:hypothetical protein
MSLRKITLAEFVYLFVSFWDHLESSVISFSVRLVISALFVVTRMFIHNLALESEKKNLHSFVRVPVLAIETVLVLDVLESGVHQATVATLVALWPRAVDEVLLGEIRQLAKDLRHLPLKSSSGGEGPARAALSLILDFRDGALFAPINRLGELALVGVNPVEIEGVFVEAEKLARLALGMEETVVSRSKFFGALVAVFVHAERERLLAERVLEVVLFDVEHVLHPCSHSRVAF